MKKYLFLILAFAVTFTSCSKDDEVLPDEETEINLTTGSWKSLRLIDTHTPTKMIKETW